MPYTQVNTIARQNDDAKRVRMNVGIFFFDSLSKMVCARAKLRKYSRAHFCAGTHMNFDVVFTSQIDEWTLRA